MLAEAEPAPASRFLDHITTDSEAEPCQGRASDRSFAGSRVES